MRKLKILVTGGAGQIGSEFERLARDCEHDIVVYARCDLDISKPHELQRKLLDLAPDAIVNCAAYTAVDNAEDQIDEAYQLNHTAVANLASFCAQQKIFLVHYSTDYVFDGTSSTPYCEKDIPNPQGVYGASKLAGEESIRDQLPEHLIIRVSWIFGRVGRSFVDTILRLAGERSELRIVRDQIGIPNSAMWIAKVTIRMLERAIDQPNSYGTYHLSSEPETSWFEFSQEIVKVAVRLGLIAKAPEITPILTTEYPTKATRPMYSVLSGAKACDTYGIEANDWRDDLEASLSHAASRQNINS